MILGLAYLALLLSLIALSYVLFPYSTDKETTRLCRDCGVIVTLSAKRIVGSRVKTLCDDCQEIYSVIRDAEIKRVNES